MNPWFPMIIVFLPRFHGLPPGHPTTAARLASPSGLALAQHYVFLADTGNGKATPEKWYITHEFPMIYGTFYGELWCFIGVNEGLMGKTNE